MASNTNTIRGGDNIIKKELKPDIGGIIVGAVFILIGTLMLLSNIYGFNLINIMATYWPVILIITGIGILLNEKKSSKKK